MRNGKRIIKKQVWYTIEENNELLKLIKKSGLNQSDYIRYTTLNKEIKEKPDDRFYEVMKLMRSISNNLNQISKKAHTLGFIDELKYKIESEKLDDFIDNVRTKFLT